jgi:hypothetical protein
VTREHSIGHGSTPRGTGPGLEVAARFDEDVVSHEINPEAVAKGRDVRDVVATGRAGVVIDVVHGHRELGFQGQ